MTLSITEVSGLTGVRPSALRYYESVGLIAPVARHGGRRHYDAAVIARLGIIALCQNAGFTVAEMSELLDPATGGRRRWQALAERKLDELDHKVTALRAMQAHLRAALACDCGDAEGCQLVEDAAARRHARS